MKTRKPFVAGNWKMNGDIVFNDHLLGALRSGVERALLSRIDVVVCPPFPYLGQASSLLRDCGIDWGAQNACALPNGAYTGEVSAAMLADLGCRWVILGHSERRQIAGETDELVAAKVAMSASLGLGVIACVGETLGEREAGDTERVLARQVDAIVSGLGEQRLTLRAECLVVAYEPVWAIGTGRSASPQMAQEAHAFIRSRLASLASGGQQTRILYGGSVKPENAASLFEMPDVDGGLIGGASLIADDFLAICRAAAALS